MTSAFNLHTSALTAEGWSKAETLSRLQPKLKHGIVLPLIRIPALKWKLGYYEESDFLSPFLKKHGLLIVRSSHSTEDFFNHSAAGKFLSVPNVQSYQELLKAIDAVIESYGNILGDDDEVIIQPMATNIITSGVAMTRDPETGFPYLIIEYSGEGDTDSVTSGKKNVFSFVMSSRESDLLPNLLRPLLSTIDEIEVIFGQKGMDIEFGITNDNVIIFQCRPIVFNKAVLFLDQLVLETRTKKIEKTLSRHMRRDSPYLGERTIYSTMADWNPAEIIGLKPRPFALSLYKYLVTDVVWSQARTAYGYTNTSRSLMKVFGGTPYIDVRASFTSFIPENIPDRLKNDLVSYSIEKLINNPHLHDKIEFEVIPTCFTPSLESESVIKCLSVTLNTDLREYVESLRELTLNIISPSGLFDGDMKKIPKLASERSGIKKSSPNAPALAWEMIKRVRLLGTPLFTRLARSAFIATNICKSIEKECNIDGFSEMILAGIETVSSNIVHDFSELSRSEFLARHGHVRPGTYDIRVPRYDESPEKYFSWEIPAKNFKNDFISELDFYRPMVERLMKSVRFQLTMDRLIDFTRRAVAAREEVKYHFTRLLSDALATLTCFGESIGLSLEDLSFITVSDLTSDVFEKDTKKLLDIIAIRRAQWKELEAIRLPALITKPEDALSFSATSAHPNFITRLVSEGPAVSIDHPILEGGIVFLKQADPGFDWIFTKKIAGFITAYGGENSHMAIRAREFGIPAVIGAGEDYYRLWEGARRIRLNCVERKVEILH